MGPTRIEQAVDEIDFLADEFEPTCDDIRLAWLARALEGGDGFDALWNDR